MSAATQFSIKPFDDLTNVDVYHILRARAQVFVVEQNCAYQDIDGIDFDCLHLIAHKDSALTAYCRIIPPDIIKPTIHANANNKTAPLPSMEDTNDTSESEVTPHPASQSSANPKSAKSAAKQTLKDNKPPCYIGRVLVMPNHRGGGQARQLMQQALDYCQKEFKNHPVQLSAQTYLTTFYASFGFTPISEPYLEDGIEHIDMILLPLKKRLPSLPSLKLGNGKSWLINGLLLIVALILIGTLYLLI